MVQAMRGENKEKGCWKLLGQAEMFLVPPLYVSFWKKSSSFKNIWTIELLCVKFVSCRKSWAIQSTAFFRWTAHRIFFPIGTMVYTEKNNQKSRVLHLKYGTTKIWEVKKKLTPNFWTKYIKQWITVCVCAYVGSQTNTCELTYWY